MKGFPLPPHHLTIPQIDLFPFTFFLFSLFSFSPHRKNTKGTGSAGVFFIVVRAGLKLPFLVTYRNEGRVDRELSFQSRGKKNCLFLALSLFFLSSLQIFLPLSQPALTFRKFFILLSTGLVLLRIHPSSS